jgi:hypothetical protein
MIDVHFYGKKTEIVMLCRFFLCRISEEAYSIDVPWTLSVFPVLTVKDPPGITMKLPVTLVLLEKLTFPPVLLIMILEKVSVVSGSV